MALAYSFCSRPHLRNFSTRKYHRGLRRSAFSATAPEDHGRAVSEHPVGERRASCKQCHTSGAVERRALLSVGLSAALLAQQSAQAEECNLVTAANGLQYCDTRVGTGKEPTRGQLIRCHYTGRLASNNAVFDSSYDRRRPLSFQIGAQQVIKGWDQGILGGQDGIPAMKEGGKRRLVVPPTLAYGARGAGGIIPPNATLIFDVELLGKR